ncbi:YsnF/AvaK domain-containing protein [Kitasatospora sp. NPDC048540]|uniref:YsnF/AvaK domain-containing protein n=1 Tax=Kitasatospora sp. NPDC048540 TaxID=3155634 RepID=UPI0034084358
MAADRSKDRDFGKVSSSPQTMTAPEPSATNAAPFAPHAAAPVAAPAPAPAAAPQAAPAEDPPTMQLGSPLAAHQATTQHGAPQSAAPQPSNHHDAQGDTRMPGAAQQPSGPASSAPSGPVEITCREERLDITTEWHVLGTARLRKYVTSEPVERKVPVVRERVRVERVPVTEAERASLTEQEIVEGMEEVTLREERAVVRKYLAPIERVRLVVERYTEEEVIREELRREQVEIHDSTSATNPPVPPPVGPVQRPAESLRPEPLRPS